PNFASTTSLLITFGEKYANPELWQLKFENDSQTRTIFKFLQKYFFRVRRHHYSVLEVIYHKWLYALFQSDSIFIHKNVLLSLSNKKYKTLVLKALRNLSISTTKDKILLSRLTFFIFVELELSTHKYHYIDTLYKKFENCTLSNSQNKKSISKMIDFFFINRKSENKLIEKIKTLIPQLTESNTERDLPSAKMLTKIMLACTLIDLQLFNDSQDCEDDFELKDYLINSSHNTYLTSNQLSGNASAEPYRYTLNSGVRCIELDIYDGTSKATNSPKQPSKQNNTDSKSTSSSDSNHIEESVLESEKESCQKYPIVTHTMYLNVTPIEIVPILKAIAESAFFSSDLPVILSFENHCSLSGQNVLAKLLVDYLGKYLVTEEELFAKMQQNNGKVILNHFKNKIFVFYSIILLVYLIQIKNKKKWSDEQNFKIDEYLSSLISYYTAHKFEDTNPLNLLNFYKKQIKVSDSLSNNLKKPNKTPPPHICISLNAKKCFKLLGISKNDTVTYESKFKDNQIMVQNKKPANITVDIYQVLEFLRLNTIRVYPYWTHVLSTNFSPLSLHLNGVQMIALNHQTQDFFFSMLTNIFKQHRNRGYILKPTILRSTKGPSDINLTNQSYFSLSISFLSLQFKNSSILSARVYGVAGQCHSYHFKLSSCSKKKCKGHLCSRELGNLQANFDNIKFPECCYLLLKLKDKDGYKYQCCYPLYALSTGYSCVLLYKEVKNQIYSSASVTLFIDVEFTKSNQDKETEPIRDLPARLNRLNSNRKVDDFTMNLLFN
ncbi:MAG: hypothetical protein MHPSP_000684, partial [Paramarteilia canceri]